MRQRFKNHVVFFHVIFIIRGLRVIAVLKETIVGPILPQIERGLVFSRLQLEMSCK